MTKKLNFCFSCTVLVVSSVLLPFRANAESTIQLVQGKVEEINSSEHQAVISVADPKTGLAKVYQIKIDSATKFVRIKNLKEIRPGDVVSIDFSQGPKGYFIASRFEFVERASIQNSDGAKENPSNHNDITESNGTLF